MNRTLDYYDCNAHDFVKGTTEVNMDPIYDRFLRYIAPHSKIMDLGCGSGRDSKYFRSLGHVVLPVDGSREICMLASEYLGIEVPCMSFDEIDFSNEFDAVWACASLLHITKIEMESVLEKVTNALKQGGILYASYKYGNNEREDKGRHFSDYTEKDLPSLFSAKLHLECVEWWVSGDARPDRSDKWLNIICKKSEHE